MDALLSGSVAGIVADVITHPIGTIKTRLQVQGAGGASGALTSYGGIGGRAETLPVGCGFCRVFRKDDASMPTRQKLSKTVVVSPNEIDAPAGIGEAATSIVRTEGAGALYKGLGVVVATAAPAQALFFLGLDATNDALKPRLPPAVASFAAGFCAQLCGSMLWVPMDTIKERLQIEGQLAKGSKEALGTSWGAIKTVYMKEGIRGYFPAHVRRAGYVSDASRRRRGRGYAAETRRRGHDADMPRRHVAPPPRPRRGYSAESRPRRGYSAESRASTRICRGGESTPRPRRGYAAGSRSRTYDRGRAAGTGSTSGPGRRSTAFIFPSTTRAPAERDRLALATAFETPSAVLGRRHMGRRSRRRRGLPPRLFFSDPRTRQRVAGVPTRKSRRKRSSSRRCRSIADPNGWPAWPCGVVAGVVAGAATNPMDLVKTRLQVARADPSTFQRGGRVGKSLCFGWMFAAVPRGLCAGMPT